MGLSATDEALAWLRQEIGRERVIDEGAETALAGHDIFTLGAPVAAITRPGCLAHVQALIACARAHRLALVPRGGGMSYTRAIVSGDPARTIVVDMRDMNAIREVSVRDLYVVVEPGCTWQALDDRLRQDGLETPFRGPVSGRLATIGGGIAQNAVFYGSGLFGMAADNVLGLEVVAGNGEVIRTGSLGITGGSPFLRHFGPDLTGLFTSDCGAMGVKTAIVLKLRREPATRDAISVLATDIGAVLPFLEAIGHASLAAQTMALDVRLQEDRVRQTGWRQRLAVVRALFTGAGSARRRIAEGASLARAGLKTSNGRGMAIHLFVEGGTPSDTDARKAAIGAIAKTHGLGATNSAVALAMIRTPFQPVTGLAGGPGERWVPAHFILPHSRAQDGMDAIHAVLSHHAEAIRLHGIKVRHLIANLGAGAVTLEPMFLWKDRLTPAAHRTLIDQGGSADPEAFQRPDAAEAVATIRAAMIARIDAIGAVHTQLGRQYPYLPRLAEGTAHLFGAVHDWLDPDRIMNPGVLGTTPADLKPNA